tara:strand:- start:816 stop:1037 length:222 start_codon:yes stop_codon:yes gene_type:complete
MIWIYITAGFLWVLAAILTMKYDACFGQVPTWRKGWIFNFTSALFFWPFLAICMILVPHRTFDSITNNKSQSL